MHRRQEAYRFARAEVEARLTGCGVGIFHKGERIAVHLRASGNRKHTTVPEHMPSSHRRYAGWTIERIREDARKIGPATAALCEQILENRPHPEQGYRACLGSSVSPAHMARRASRPPPDAPSRSAPGPIAPSHPPSTTNPIAGPPHNT